jgi:hypothetical protein
MKYHVFIIMSPKKLVGWPAVVRWIISFVFDISEGVDTLIVADDQSIRLPSGFTTHRKIGEVSTTQMDLDRCRLDWRNNEEFL